ncbi:MAG TPA: helix-turn-helix domain-containing protein, partial [Candidatus Coprovivens excrementavium]|nr:helix-turn-helix domain-containing protein [Candidatus Coprovivens excrementavium]
LRSTREESGVSLEEASGDLEIKTLILENIEDGNIGCFKDIFVLKDYIYDYAKYLGLEPDKIIDEFNEYLFEYTSKIPLEDIEKAMKEQQKEEIPQQKIVSPYTNSTKKPINKVVLLLLIALGVLVVLILFWSVKQITVNNMTTNMISYVDSSR